MNDLGDRKRCRKCGVEKPIHGFYANPKCVDGHANTCRVCQNLTKRRREWKPPFTLQNNAEEYKMRFQKQVRPEICKRGHPLGFGRCETCHNMTRAERAAFDAARQSLSAREKIRRKEFFCR